MQSSSGAKSQQTPRQKGFAAVFIDFENIYYYLKESYADLPDLNDYILDMLRNLRAYLDRRLGLQTILTKAYADFEQLKIAPQGGLYLMGVETHNVLGTDHKNAADMRLSIDAVETLYTRPEIDTFVFVAGDRDYIPVIQHLKRQARHVYAVAFRGNISSDLMMNVSSRYFIDAVSLLDPTAIKRLEQQAERQREADVVERQRDERQTAELEAREAAEYTFDGEEYSSEIIDDEYEDFDEEEEEVVEGEESYNGNGPFRMQPRGNRKIVAPTDPTDAVFADPNLIESDTELTCLDVLLRNYGHHREVWISPYLRKLTDALPRLADFERKALLTSLEAQGAIKIEKRRGEPYDYSIILINHDHPDVVRMIDVINEE